MDHFHIYGCPDDRECGAPIVIQLNHEDSRGNSFYQFILKLKFEDE